MARTALWLVLSTATLAILAWAAVPLLTSGLLRDADDTVTLLLFLLALGLPLWACFRQQGASDIRSFDLLQPGTVLACLFYVYIVVPAFHVWRDLGYHSTWLDPSWPPAPLFHFTLAVCLLGLVAFRFGYHTNLQWHQQQPSDHQPSEAEREWPGWASVLAALMLVIGSPFVLRHLAALGGLTSDVLLFLSPTWQAESGVQVGGVATLLESFFAWGALLLLFRAFIKNKQRVLSASIVVAAFLLVYLVNNGKRSVLFPVILYPAVWLHYLRRRITVARGVAYFAAAFLLVTLLLFARTVGPYMASKGFNLRAVPAELALAPARFYLNSPELAVFDMTMLAVQDRQPLLRDAGGRFWGGLRYNLAPAAYVVPRFLWPSKPVFRDLGTLFYQRSVGGRVEVAFAVGIVGGLYLFGGVIGVIVGMFLVGMFLNLMYTVLRPWTRNPWRVFIYAVAFWMTFHVLRFGNLGSTMMYFLHFEMVGTIAGVLLLITTGPLAMAARQRQAVKPGP